MNKSWAILILGLLALNTPCFAQNLCEIAIPLSRATEYEQRTQFDNSFRGRTFSGSGPIFDVEGERDSRYVNLIVSCSDEVRIHLQLKNDLRIRYADYKVGQEVSFWGQCIDMKRGYYKNAPGRYFHLVLGGDSIQVK